MQTPGGSYVSKLVFKSINACDLSISFTFQFAHLNLSQHRPLKQQQLVVLSIKIVLLEIFNNLLGITQFVSRGRQ